MSAEDKVPTAVELQGRVVELELRANNLRRALEDRVVRRYAGGIYCQLCHTYFAGQSLVMPGDKHKDTCPLWVPAEERNFTGF